MQPLQSQSGSSLLFIHQNKNQQRLIKQYGDSICLLDATYKTTKYAAPLFFVVLKTNVDYQLIGSIICIARRDYCSCLRRFICFKVLESFVAAKIFHGWQLQRSNSFICQVFVSVLMIPCFTLLQVVRK